MQTLKPFFRIMHRFGNAANGRNTTFVKLKIETIVVILHCSIIVRFTDHILDVEVSQTYIDPIILTFALFNCYKIIGAHK